MSQTNRLSNGGRIDRNKVLSFTFNGQSYKGFEGDSLASAITAGLARGMSLVDAVALGKEFITRAVEHSYPLGAGHGPVRAMPM